MVSFSLFHGQSCDICNKKKLKPSLKDINFISLVKNNILPLPKIRFLSSRSRIISSKVYMYLKTIEDFFNDYLSKHEGPIMLIQDVHKLFSTPTTKPEFFQQCHGCIRISHYFITPRVFTFGNREGMVVSPARCYVWVGFVYWVSLCSKAFFPGSPIFFPLPKPTLSKF